jgi:hypothetical protein
MVAAFVLVLGLATLPLVLASHVPLIDYPFHLARMAILDRHGDDAFLQGIYAVHLHAVPNVAMDLVVLGLAKILPVEVASRAFIGISFALTLSGVAALGRVLHGGTSLPTLVLGAALLHNWIFLFGFLNYLFGLGVLLWATAVWIATETRPLWSRIALGLPFALVLYFSHLVAFALFCLVLAGLGVQRALRQRRLEVGVLARETTAALGACFLPMVLFVFFSPTSADAAGGFVFQTFASKAKSMLLTPLSASIAADAILFLGLGAATLLVLLRGRIRFSGTTLGALVAVLLAFLSAPVGTSAGHHLDDRIPLALLLLAVGSLGLQLPTGVLGRLTAVALLVALGGRMIVVTHDWRRWDQEFAEARAAFAALEPASVVYVATAEGPPTSGGVLARYDHLRPPERHLGSYAALQPGVFVPMVYAHPQLQPISVRPELVPVAELQGFDPLPVPTPQDLHALVERIRIATTLAPPLVRHVYLVVQRPGAWSDTIAALGAPAAASTETFVILKLR